VRGTIDSSLHEKCGQSSASDPENGLTAHLDRDVGAEAVTDDDIGTQLAGGEFPG
jgi:hypothetical protein